MSLNPFASFVLFLKKECSHFFYPLPHPRSRNTNILKNPTVRSRWAHTYCTRHKYCCTPAVVLVQVVLGYGSNACLHHSKKSYTCYIPAGFIPLRLALSPGCGSPLAVCLSRRREAFLSLSLPGGGISSPTRRERAEREEGRRVCGVAWCVCVCVCIY